MEKLRAILPAIKGIGDHKKALNIGVAVLIVALIIALCISIHIRGNIQRQNAAINRQMGEALYYNLNMLRQTFDMTAVPTADIQNSVLPQMYEYFVASVTLNDLYKNCYDARYSVMTESDVNALRSAFSAYDQAFASGSSTDLAQADMQRCIDNIKDVLQTRFSGMSLKPAR